MRAAASSMASGSPSRRRQIAATAAALSSVRAKSGSSAARPVDEEAHRGDLAQLRRAAAGGPGRGRSGGTGQLLLAGQRQAGTAGDQDRQAWGGGKQIVATTAAGSRCSKLSSTSRSRRPPSALPTVCESGLAGLLPHPQRRGDRAGDQRRVGERGEIDEDHAIREVGAKLAGGPDRQPRLADAARRRSASATAPAGSRRSAVAVATSSARPISGFGGTGRRRKREGLGADGGRCAVSGGSKKPASLLVH